MISKDTIEKIFDVARIDEVVSEFVTLKKRGVNLLGNCPFHNEKTPSFTVSPAKGIYKCFGCGKAGNSVDFIMTHEQLSYPEALRFLAKKYNIEIEEDASYKKEDPSVAGEKEALYAVTEFAARYFKENLVNSDEGRSVGLSYFHERGFLDVTLEKFLLGYSFDQWRGFTDAAIAAGFKEEYLVRAGLTIKNDSGKVFDRFSARVIFPIHNITGRVIGFGGRTLKDDKKTAKYINSPETEIYHKSNVLYGMYFAKKQIVADDNCILVEGYADVISLHQAGIENAVASSGTSLTIEQIRLIRRYTKNVTILYDGDSAGIKASLRGIDLVLEEGMNVKVLLLPDGEDPDSFSFKVTREELKAYIKDNSTDFISFKTSLLYNDAKRDPIKKAELITEIVNSIALIPDGITRTVYLKECSRIMEIDEQVLISELNKIRARKLEKQAKDLEKESSFPVPENIHLPEEKAEFSTDSFHQEREIIRLLLNYGDRMIHLPDMSEPVSVAEYVITLFNMNEIVLNHETFRMIYSEFEATLSQDIPVNPSSLIQHHDPVVAKTAADILSSPYSLSPNWEDRYKISVTTEEHILKTAVESTVYSLTLKRIFYMIEQVGKELQKEGLDDERLIELIERKKILDEFKSIFSKQLGRVIL